MTLRDMVEQFDIQGRWVVKVWQDDCNDYAIIEQGEDLHPYQLEDAALDAPVVYMYAIDGCLNIEIDMEV